MATYIIHINGLQNDNKTPFYIKLISEEIFFDKANKFGRPSQLNLIDFEREEGCSLIDFFNKASCILSLYQTDRIILNLNKCAVQIHKITI